MPEIPQGAKTPQDRKTKKPTKKERLEIEFRGGTYTLIRDDARDDVDVMEAFEEGKVTVALRLLFGEREYARIKSDLADDEGRTKATDIVEFFNTVVERVQDVKN